MDTLYSLSLLLALMLGAVGTAALVHSMILRLSGRRRNFYVTRFPIICGGAALLAGVFSAIVHLLFGHDSDSLEPMAPGQFMMQHKAYWVVLALAIPALLGRIVAVGLSRLRQPT